MRVFSRRTAGNERAQDKAGGSERTRHLDLEVSVLFGHHADAHEGGLYTTAPVLVPATSSVQPTRQPAQSSFADTLSIPGIQFESKSNRVKGIAFHPRQPLLAASLHNGNVQLWNYQMGTLVGRLDEHDGE